jgi:uncharacterized protein (TIGR02996 family)
MVREYAVRVSLAEMLDQLDAALAANDQPRALAAAVAAWRETRSVELADLVDRITERCELFEPPHTRSATHRWWMTHALRPDLDALTIGSLIAAFPIRMQVDSDVDWRTMRARWAEPNPIIVAITAEPVPAYWQKWRRDRGEDPDDWPLTAPNWVDRLAAMYRWPDDPRLTRVLVDMLAKPDVMVYGESNKRMAQAIADRLISLADRRAADWVAKLPVDKPYATYKQNIVNPLVPQIVHAIPEPSPHPRIAALGTVAPASPGPDLAALWDEVAEHPDDDAPRLVLADALIAAGDNRGEVIALQCVTDPLRRGHANTQAHRLMRTEWSRWMGDLAQILARKGTEMSRGMLDKIRLGLTATPPWVWESTRGHRELSVVREVRPAHAPPLEYARFIAALPSTPRFVGFDASESIVELARLRPSLRIEEVFYTSNSAIAHYRRDRPTFEAMFHALAQIAPTLARLELGPLWWVTGKYTTAVQLQPSDYVAMIEQLPSLFPHAQSLRIPLSTIPQQARPAVGALAARGFELIDDVWRWPGT